MTIPEDCNYWVLHSTNFEGEKSKVLMGMKMKKKPSNKNASKYSKILGLNCVWTHWWRFFDTEKQAMEFFK